MTNKEFIEWLWKVNESPTQYATGAFGAVIGVKNNRERYAKNSSEKTAKKIMEAPDGTFMFDCIGLGKAYLWGFDFNDKMRYGGAEYKKDGIPDFGVKNFHKYCSTWTADGCEDPSVIVPGEWLRTKDKTHVAYYVGNEVIIECTQKGDCKVRAHPLSSRKWDGHGQIQYIDYDGREKGDVNGDGKINLNDCLMCKRIVLGTYKPTPAEKWAADINNDGKVTIADYLRLKRLVKGN